MAILAEKTVLDALEMCDVGGRNVAVRSVAWLKIRPIIGDALDKGIVAGQVYKAAMRAVVHPILIQVATDAARKEDQLMRPIAAFELNYVRKGLPCVKRNENHQGPE